MTLYGAPLFSVWPLYPRRCSQLFPQHLKMRLLQKSTVSQSCKQDCPDFAERMKRKALRVRSEESIPTYVTEAESRKRHSDSPLCNSLKIEVSRMLEASSVWQDFQMYLKTPTFAEEFQVHLKCLHR